MHRASPIIHSRAVLSRVPPDPAARKHSKTTWARASRDALEPGTHSIPPRQQFAYAALAGGVFVFSLIYLRRNMRRKCVFYIQQLGTTHVL